MIQRVEADHAVIVRCQDRTCEERLGIVQMSVVDMKSRPVWHIGRGWHFRNGILEQTDYEFRSERKLSHELFGRQSAPEGTEIGREVDLPVVVRCPRCRRLRYVTQPSLFNLA